MRSTKFAELDETTDYAKSVTSGQQPACRWVRLACERHIRDLKRKDVWFDARAARRFFKYSELQTHYEGPYAGKPLKLSPWQKFFFGNMYGWKRVISGVPTNIWRFNYGYCEVPRKNGKTTMTSVAASYDCGFVVATGAQVYCLATKEDQAKVVYRNVNAFISQSDELSAEFETLRGANTIYSVRSGRTSFIKPLGADSKKQDGLNPISAICDELHAWPSRDLWDVMDDAFGARDNWHMLAITTAGHNKDGICWEQRQHLIDILEQRIECDNKFGVIYTIDRPRPVNGMEQPLDWKNEKLWFIANPELGHGKQLDYMRSQCLAAQQMPSKLNAFLNKQLNVWTDVAEAWLDTDLWRSRVQIIRDDPDLRSKSCFAGIDLAKVNDLSSVGYFFPVQSGLNKCVLVNDFYLPQDGIREKARKEGVDYQRWAEEGHLVLTPGPTTDYAFIRAGIQKRAALHKIGEIGYDRHFALEIINELTALHLKCEPVGMGFMDMAAPTAEFERLLVANEMVHNGNPLMTYCVANVVVRRDPAGNIKPDKEESKKRIDGVVAAIVAIARKLQGKRLVSKYESQNLILLHK